MITINKIPPPKVNLYSPDNKFMGTINEYEFNDIRIQIMESKVEGYYIVDADGGCYIINENGRLPVWPKCFHILTDQVTKLLVGMFK